MSYRDVWRTVLPQDSSRVIQYQFTDLDDLPIPGSDLHALTLTLYDLESGVLINGRDNQSILGLDGIPLNGGMVDEDGLLTLELAPADMVIQSEDVYAPELHILLFRYSWNAGAKRNWHELLITVGNLTDVPLVS